MFKDNNILILLSCSPSLSNVNGDIFLFATEAGVEAVEVKELKRNRTGEYFWSPAGTLPSERNFFTVVTTSMDFLCTFSCDVALEETTTEEIEEIETTTSDNECSECSETDFSSTTTEEQTTSTTTETSTEPTTTTRSTTTSTTTTTTTTPLKCRAMDSRNMSWIGDPGENVTRPCFNDSAPGDVASWLCQYNGEFQGSEPDRSDCTHPWMNDIDDMVDRYSYFILK